MGVAGIKRGSCPPILYSISTKHYEETLLKVSFKIFHPFKSYQFLKNTTFSKMALKQKFSVILGNHFIGLFNGILHVLILRVVPEKQGFWFIEMGVYTNMKQTVGFLDSSEHIKLRTPLHWN